MSYLIIGDVHGKVDKYWKIYLTSGNRLTLDKMEEMLEKYGATVIKDKQWCMPE